ncbi:class I SAM-dependent methyltransferase [Sphingorhabdus sp. EL138]|uniref:class I SAM-dependent DNA methyltransferase n=1 Tax=Sphingorhabdus sp. EL138 TaxID=2073156 RepID=UPI000D688254|nr:class I SAM-dependent methyltransferase [Sphingorhabdus sp. EL138]
MSDAAKQIIDLYRRHALPWVERRGTELKERKWVDRLIQLLPAQPSILDAGSGSGSPIGCYLIAKGCALTGVDTSLELIDIARQRGPGGQWVVDDMRVLQLDHTFNGILAWNSIFHLTPEEQRQMFSVFAKHAAPSAVLVFTSGPQHSVEIGEFEGGALYHASLDATEYCSLLEKHGFRLLDHVVEDP